MSIVPFFDSARPQVFAHRGGCELGPENTIAAFRSDPMAYGVKAARNVLDAICDYVCEQGLTSRRVALEEVFAPSTLDL